MDFTVTFSVQVTASSPEEAGRFALSDLRDEDLGPWEAEASCSRGKVRIMVESGCDEANECTECGGSMFLTETGIAHHGESLDSIDHDLDADHVALAPGG